MSSNTRPVKALQVACGASHTCVLLETNQVKCFGDGGSGRLGHESHSDIGDDFGETGDNIPIVDFGSSFTPVQICAGGAHTCARSDAGEIACFGYGPAIGTSGTIGDFPGTMGDNLPRVNLTESAMDVQCGVDYTCAIMQSGQLQCWGNNEISYSDHGKLGLESDKDSFGSKPEEMGINLPYVKLGTDRTAKSVSLGDEHFCVVLDDATTKCFGEGDDGRRGSNNDLIVGEAVNSTGDFLSAVNLTMPVKFVAAGKEHSCVVLEDDHARCFGDNFYGQLGRGNSDSRVGESTNQIPDQLVKVDLGEESRVRQMSLGIQVSCLVTFENELKCFGSGGGGLLMNGDTYARTGSDPSDMGTNIKPINFGSRSKSVLQVSVSSGGYSGGHACVILGNALPGDVVCWGNGIDGQTGAGTHTSYGDTTGEMGGEGIPAPVKLGSFHIPGTGVPTTTQSPSEATATLSPTIQTGTGAAQSAPESTLVLGGTLGSIALIGMFAVMLLVMVFRERRKNPVKTLGTELQSVATQSEITVANDPERNSGYQ